MSKVTLLIFLHVTCLLIQVLGSRPFYLFAHMSNTVKDVDDALDKGANAVEADLQFGLSGKPLRIFHGIPCDCWRNCLGSTSYETYLSYIRDLGIPGHSKYNERFSLLYLDLKLNSILPAYRVMAGQNLAQALIEHFFNSDVLTQVQIILGIPNTNAIDVLQGFRAKFFPGKDHLLQNIGFDVISRESIGLISEMFSLLNITSRTWLGDGISNCFPALDHGLRQALIHRDFSSSFVNKVYFWTVDWKTNMRNALRLNVDAIMTNNVDVLHDVLTEQEFTSKYYLATNSDNPWKKMQGTGPLRLACSQDTCWKDCNFNGEWCWTSKTGCTKNVDTCSLSSTCVGRCGFSFFNPSAIIQVFKKLWPFS